MRLTNGYTLIELSIVITILSIIAASTITILGKKNQADDIRLTQKKMDVVAEAIQNFFDMNGYLPCPASGAAAENSASFGITPTGGADNNYDESTRECVTVDAGMGDAGVVPTRTLNLPDEYMYDSWGRRLTYRIASGTGNKSHFQADITRGDLSIININGSELTEINKAPPYNYGAAYVIISHGSNGYYGWLKSGINMPANVSSTIEEENYDHQNDKVYVQAERSTYFDDITIFRRMNDISQKKMTVAPIRLQSIACNDAQMIEDNGLGSLESDATYADMATKVIEAAKVLSRVCSAQQPSSTDCSPNLRWLGPSTTPSRTYSDCQCFGESQGFITAFNYTDGVLGTCKPDFTVDVPATACANSPVNSAFTTASGIPLTITASTANTWSHDFPAFALYSAAGSTSADATSPSTNSPVGALIARIDDDSTAGNKDVDADGIFDDSWFMVGSEITITPSFSGTIYFAINEPTATCPLSNSGQISSVKISQ